MCFLLTFYYDVVFYVGFHRFIITGIIVLDDSDDITYLIRDISSN